MIVGTIVSSFPGEKMSAASGTTTKTGTDTVTVTDTGTDTPQQLYAEFNVWRMKETPEFASLVRKRH